MNPSRHATKNENKTAEIAETAERDLSSAFSVPSAVIFTGIAHVLTHAMKDENVATETPSPQRTEEKTL